MVDRRENRQFISNLLSNSVNLTPAGSPVMLHARCVDGANAGAMEIAVIDTGVGIAPEDQMLVFEKFRRASGDYPRRSEDAGSGCR